MVSILEPESNGNSNLNRACGNWYKDDESLVGSISLKSENIPLMEIQVESIQGTAQTTFHQTWKGYWNDN